MARWLADVFPERASSPEVCADALSAACAGGHIPVAAWLAAQPQCDRARESPRALRAACARGQLEMARWVAGELAPSTFHAKCPSRNTLNVLVDACAGGHTEVARWYADDYLCLKQPSHFAPMSFAQHVHETTMTALQRACAGGHVATAEWLRVRFDIVPTRDPWVSVAQRDACLAGRAEVVAWLVRVYGPGTLHGAPLHQIYRRGHFSTATLVADAWWPGADPAARRAECLPHINWALCDACEAGDMATVQRLVTHHALTAAELRGYGGGARHASHLADPACTAKWFGPAGSVDPAADPAAAAAAFAVPAIRAACAFDHGPVVHWLAARCEIALPKKWWPFA